MVIVESYPVAVVMCIITMLCWGSWANTQKLASKEWRFQLFYWDYAIGVFLLSLAAAFTMGSLGTAPRTFLSDLGQAAGQAIGLAILGGVLFNLANILLVAALDIAGMAVAFPVGIGIALVEGVLINYVREPKGDPLFLFLGVGGVAIAIVVDALAYKRLATQGQRTPTKGIVLSIVAGVLMGVFYYVVAASMTSGDYAAVVLFSGGLLLSNFVWNSWVMAKPFVGDPVPLGDYFSKGNTRLHLIGIVGGMIWNVGFSFNMVASAKAGFAISYGLGQGATMIAAIWGVFIWREFKSAPAGTNGLLALMFACYAIGLGLITYAGA
jgi:glucose uptake protein